MSPRIAICFAVLGLSACDNDRKIPDPLISSARVVSAKLDMTVTATTYTETEGELTTSTTDVEVYLHTHDKYGFTQYVELVGDDSLTVSTSAGSQVLEGNLLPNREDAIFVEYSSEIPLTAEGSVVETQLNRSEGAEYSTVISLLAETPLSVTFPGAVPSLADELTVAWEAIDGYQYQLGFVFTCELVDGRSIGFKRRFRANEYSELLNPFTLNLAEVEPPAVVEEIDHCEIAVVLVTDEDQSPEGSQGLSSLGAFASRVQRIIYPLELTADEAAPVE